MNEKPILFSGEMVRAILDGRKTQTRRVMKPQPVKDEYDFWTWAGAGWGRDDIGAPVVPGHSLAVRCPYGRVHDRLWVRETFVFELWEDEPKPPDDRPLHCHSGDGSEWDEPYWLWPHYRATDPEPELYYEDDPNGGDGPICKWRPSIFMPRWASRITLEIVNVRVERLQGIGGTDAFAEGGFTVTQFIELWNSINASRGYGWDVNPFVWVIEFNKP